MASKTTAKWDLRPACQASNTPPIRHATSARARTASIRRRARASIRFIQQQPWAAFAFGSLAEIIFRARQIISAAARKPLLAACWLSITRPARAAASRFTRISAGFFPIIHAPRRRHCREERDFVAEARAACCSGGVPTAGLGCKKPPVRTRPLSTALQYRLSLWLVMLNRRKGDEDASRLEIRPFIRSAGDPDSCGAFLRASV